MDNFSSGHFRTYILYENCNYVTKEDRTEELLINFHFELPLPCCKRDQTYEDYR